jgi:hypothetical protein
MEPHPALRHVDPDDLCVDFDVLPHEADTRTDRWKGRALEPRTCLGQVADTDRRGDALGVHRGGQEQRRSSGFPALLTGLGFRPVAHRHIARTTA